MLFVVVMWLFGAVGDGYVMVCYVWWLYVGWLFDVVDVG